MNDRQTPNSLAAWFDFAEHGRIVVRPGKVELGQGISTAYAQLAADQFEVALARIIVAEPITGVSPDEGTTSGSKSIQESGELFKRACAAAKAVFLEHVSEIHRCPVADLHIEDGTIVGSDGRATSYWDIADEIDLARDLPDQALGQSRRHQWVGQAITRTDLLAAVTGQIDYVHNLELPGMLHARVVRPPGPFSNLKSTASDELGPRSHLFRNGDFLAVISSDEAEAVAVAARVGAKSVWSTSEDPTLPDESSLKDWLRSAESDTHSVVDTISTSRQPTLRRVYSRPFLSHGSIGPSCAVALWDEQVLKVWSSSQDIYALRRALAKLLEIDIESVTVAFKRGSGCYGQNGADDVSFEAALFAMSHPGVPIRLQWSREEELGWESYGAAAVVELAATLDDDGLITQWYSEVWSNGTGGRPGRPEEVFNFASVNLLEGFPTRKPSRLSGVTRNLIPEYGLGEVRATAHHVLENPIRTSSLRSLGAHINVYANEGFMDELAHECNMDPVDFRLAHLEDERGRAVVEAVAKASNWGRQLDDQCGVGIGYARYKGSAGYCAVVAEVEASHALFVRHLTIAVDVGVVVNPDGLKSQIEGGAIQSASWTTMEQVRFSRSAIESTTWESYPIFTFSDVPEVNVMIVDVDHHPSLGAGEISVGPTAAAIGNALFNATGVRVRDLPLTADRIRDVAASS